MNKKLFTSYLCNEDDVILQEILNEWKSLNPEYEVLYFSDSDVEEFFKDTPQYETYSKMKNGVAIADFFRICYINKFGGYWFDLDVQPISLELPESVMLKVEETEAVVKGQTAASSYKPAILTGGIKTSVPPFISTDDYVVISTNDSSYIEKAKK